MKIFILESKNNEVSYQLNELSTNLAHLAQFKIATKEILGFDINEESIDGVIVVLTKESIEENSFISDIKKFIKVGEQLFEDAKVSMEKHWKDFKEILDKKNLSRKECLLLPLRTIAKALKI